MTLAYGYVTLASLDAYGLRRENGEVNKTSPAGVSLHPARRILTTVHDELVERRRARSKRRELERDLASYTTRAQVDELFAALDRTGGADAELIRSILVRNLMRNRDTSRYAS
jgi:hypothetical protein